MYFSCSENDRHAELDLSKVNAILKLESREERKVAYSLLNDFEKAEVWKRHVFSMTKEFSLSFDQHEVVNTAIGFLIPKNMNHGFIVSEEFLAWEKDARSVFNDYYRNLFFMT
jgi:hypothetical protein